MQSFLPPSDSDIRDAYAQGEAAVIALFHRSIGQLAAQYQAREDQPDPNDWAYPPDQDAKTGRGIKALEQGDVYWVQVDAPDAPETGIGILHPHVVIQDNVINRSRVRSVVVCALTSNKSRASLPGNVLLDVGEANLPRQSVVEVSKVSVVDKMQFGEYIGSLTGQRIQQILAGMRFLQSFTGPEGDLKV